MRKNVVFTPNSNWFLRLLGSGTYSCTKHPDDKNVDDWGCFACFREVQNQRRAKERQDRITEMSEAIVKAHKQIRGHT